MTTIEELLDRHLTLFGERDQAARQQSAAQLYAPDVVFTDHDGSVIGPDAIVEQAGAVLARVPADFVFGTVGPRYVDGDTGAVAWSFGPAGAPVVFGLDILTARDGRIVTARTLLAPQP